MSAAAATDSLRVNDPKAGQLNMISVRGRENNLCLPSNQLDCHELLFLSLYLSTAPVTLVSGGLQRVPFRDGWDTSPTSCWLSLTCTSRSSSFSR